MSWWRGTGAVRQAFGSEVAGFERFVYSARMSTVLEIEAAISELPKQEFWKLAEWFDDVRERTWDEQMAADAQAGKLDFLFAEAEASRQAGKNKPWPVGA